MSYVGPVSFSAPESSLAVICRIYSLSHHRFFVVVVVVHLRETDSSTRQLCVLERERFLLKLILKLKLLGETQSQSV